MSCSLLLRQEPITFQEFMHLALYHPEAGYYTQNITALGNGGDFITAPEITPLFGYTIAAQCREIMALMQNPRILEFGAGSGKLCIDILTALARHDALPEQYLILEPAAKLAHQQQLAIKAAIPDLAHLVTWVTDFPAPGFIGVILANEVLDAMPVARFLATDDAVLESYIHCEDDKLVEEFKPSSSPELINYVKMHVHHAPYISEFNPHLAGWMASLAAMIDTGVILLIDYGFPRHEYYHADRNTGTIMCHYQQQAHENFLLYPGEQDITAHVDFTAVAEAAHASELEVYGYTSQAAFLLGNGLLELLQTITENRQYLAQSQACQKLLQPHEMGELFKVMAAGKNFTGSMAGFSLYDRRNSL